MTEESGSVLVTNGSGCGSGRHKKHGSGAATLLLLVRSSAEYSTCRTVGIGTASVYRSNNARELRNILYSTGTHLAIPGALR
jgi:hypothetical protein